MTQWTKQRMQGASVAPRTAEYEVVNLRPEQEQLKLSYPHIFEFEALSVGDGEGQLFAVPLDESSQENAEFILRAIAAYEGE